MLTIINDDEKCKWDFFFAALSIQCITYSTQLIEELIDVKNV